ncbi:GIP [Symbiodinium sp. CCMP2456]|nr:GIP [Symbiodinium sp. CCMP2456]
MADLGFKRLIKSDPNLYFHSEFKVYLLCYVDDVLLFGAKEPCEHLFAKLQERLLLRREGMLQPGESINFLGRCITRREDAIEISMPTSYVDKILEKYDLQSCRHSPVPGNDALRKQIESEALLDAAEHRRYRRVVGTVSGMTEDHKAKVKMILRYLAGSKACVLTLRPRVKLRPEMTSLDVVAYVDSDWAGCVRTRKSTSGVSVFFNGCLLTSQTRTQQTIATSSGEAELYSIGLGTSECLFLKSLLLDMNIASRVNIRVFTDSSAGKSMSTRFGVLQVKKVAGTSNPADVLTKYVSREDFMAAARLAATSCLTSLAAMGAACVYFGLGSWQPLLDIRFCMDGLRTSHRIAPIFYYIPDCAHFGWDMVFFFEDFFAMGIFSGFSFYFDFTGEMAPQQQQLPAPKAASISCQFYVPNPHFERDEHPPRVPTRLLPGNIWMDLRYASSHFETICGLHPQHFRVLLRAADMLQVHFYVSEAARLLGRGTSHFGRDHFAGMSYFSTDNVRYTHFKNAADFLESLRQGRRVSKLLLPGTPDFRFVYAALQLQPGVENPMVTALQATSLFPELFARSTSYVANENDFCLNFKASYVAPNFRDDFGELSVRLWFCTSLNLLLMLTSRAGNGPLRLTSELQPFSVDMLNFCFCSRSAVWLASFGLQLLLETAPAEVLNFIENNYFRCWNRRYVDYVINVPGRDFLMLPHHMDSLAIIRLPGNFQQFFDLVWSKTSHGTNRFMHVPMRRSDFQRFQDTSEEDSWISRKLAVQLLRARYQDFSRWHRSDFMCTVTSQWVYPTSVIVWRTSNFTQSFLLLG